MRRSLSVANIATLDTKGNQIKSWSLLSGKNNFRVVHVNNVLIFRNRQKFAWTDGRKGFRSLSRPNVSFIEFFISVWEKVSSYQNIPIGLWGKFSGIYRYIYFFPDRESVNLLSFQRDWRISRGRWSSMEKNIPWWTHM